MQKRKLAVYLMAGAMLASSMPVTAFAETQNSVGGTQEIESTSLVDDKTSATVPVQYTVGANFNVKLPSSITLSNTDGSWGYAGTVGVKGDIDSGKSVKVKPASSITMYDVTNRPTDDVPAGADDQAYSHKDAKDAAVAQAKQQWSMTELSADTYSDTDLTLTAGAMQSGKWKGKLNVNISYGEYVVEPGVYDANGTLTTSWDELVSSGKITVTDNVIQKCDTSVSGKLIVPEGITGIVSASSSSNGAFDYCNKLTEVVLPSTMTSIGDYAFYDCTNLTSVTIPDSVTSIGDYAFYDCTNLTSITIPDSVTSIGEGAFSECTNLTSITIPDGVTSIGESAFYGCSSLTNITIPDGVTSIGDYAFSECSELTNINIPNGVTSIGEGAFSGCNSLKNITIPNGVTSIEDSTFFDCWNLKNITIPDGVISIGEEAFYRNGLTSITIPGSVTSIGDRAFKTCSYLTDITYNGTQEQWNAIPTDEYWYYETYITAIHCSDGDIYIYCDDLTDVTIPDGMTSIGTYAFSCHNLTSVTIPNSVTSIARNAFYWCGDLTSVTIPDSVTSIGENAFSGCFGLTEITYEGTKEQWNAITKNDYWNPDSSITTIHCTDGDITL